MLFVVNFFAFIAFIPKVAGGTVVAVAADVFYGREIFAVGGLGGERLGIDLENVPAALDILRGDLEAVKQEAGALGFERVGGEATEHLADGELDCTAVFED